jgi:hypothetical protein
MTDGKNQKLVRRRSHKLDSRVADRNEGMRAFGDDISAHLDAGGRNLIGPGPVKQAD